MTEGSDVKEHWLYILSSLLMGQFLCITLGNSKRRLFGQFARVRLGKSNDICVKLFSLHELLNVKAECLLYVVMYQIVI